MTVLRVLYEEGRLDQASRGALAETLTKAVLDVEVGVDSTLARAGIMVLFDAIPPGRWAVGGRFDDTHVAAGGRCLIQAQAMEGVWTAARRRLLIERFSHALSDALDLGRDAGALATCWVVFDQIADGSWGAMGSAISIRDLVEPAQFTPDRGADIERALLAPSPLRCD